MLSFPTFLVGSLGAGSGDPALPALTTMGTAQNYDANSTGRWMRYGGAEDSHIGYLGTSGGTIAIVSQSVPNLVKIDTVNPMGVANTAHIVGGSARATVAAGDYTVTFSETLEGYATTQTTVTYKVLPAVSLPFTSPPFMVSTGDSIIQFNNTTNSTGLVLNKGLSPGDGELVNLKSAYNKFHYDVWYDASNTLVTAGGARYNWGSNQGWSGGTIANVASIVEHNIALCPEIWELAVIINSIATGGTLQQPNVDAVMAIADTFHAAAPSIPVVVANCRPTAMINAIARPPENVDAFNALMPASVATRSSWMTLLDLYTGLADNPNTSSVGTLTFTAQPANTSTLTLNGNVITFGSTVTIGANLAATITNLNTYINANTGTLGATSGNTSGTAITIVTTGNTLMTVSLGGTTNATMGTIKQVAANTTALDKNFQNGGVAVVPSGALTGNDGLHPKYWWAGGAALDRHKDVYDGLIDVSTPNAFKARGTRLSAMTSAVRLFTGSSTAFTPVNGISSVGGNGYASGTLPAGWVPFATGGQSSTCVVSIEANAETGGNTFVFTITPGGTATVERFGLRNLSVATLDLLGLWGGFWADLEIDDNAAWQTATLAMLPNNNAGAYQYNGNIAIPGRGGSARRREVESEIGVYPSNMTSTVFPLTFAFAPSGASGPMVVKIREVDGRIFPAIPGLHG